MPLDFWKWKNKVALLTFEEFEFAQTMMILPTFEQGSFDAAKGNLPSG